MVQYGLMGKLFLKKFVLANNPWPPFASNIQNTLIQNTL